ncbi:MAG: TetR/AcrR family transcriptional regulator [Sneathiella sp.]|nr:TetR/AcrR family transcriptional regulator [Sneathiella sp.]
MRNAAETRAMLLDTAIQLIWQSSYHQVGVNEICRQAGVTKGAFYYHFETKADLYYAAAHNHWNEFKDEFDRQFSPSFTPLEQLQNLIDMIVDKQKNDPLADEMEVSGCPIFTAGAQVGAEEAKVIQCSREITGEVNKYHIALVRGLKADDMLNGDPNIVQVARMIHQYIQGLLIYGRVFNSLEIVQTDLKEASYRILDLKQEYRQQSVTSRIA